MSSLCTFAFSDRIAAGADFDDDAEFCRCNRGGILLRHCVRDLEDIQMDGKVSPRFDNNRDSIR